MAGLQRLEFLEGFEVHAADGVDLPPQVVDLRLHRLPLVLLLIDGLVSGFGQFDAVLLAKALDQGGPLVAKFVGRQVLGVNALLKLANLAANFLRLGGQFAPLALEGLAAVDVLDRLAGERFLADVKLGNVRFRAEDVPTARLRAKDALGQLLFAVGQGAVRSCRPSSICRSRACRLRSRSSLLASSTFASVVSRLEA